ncbi:hypothetical protein FOMPIDRAFT_86642 [Fomitopsis schrenkii]|uniref:Uncharacterized protein n=1 Tax=Fomitopsis schrenkii TaxID=2126942 RepID=S8FEP5_FOMSC|nr:hypothetical protein FOMPIDRAFT_86642 [Fomitopsis schrenkii]
MGQVDKHVLGRQNGSCPLRSLPDLPGRHGCILTDRDDPRTCQDDSNPHYSREPAPPTVTAHSPDAEARMLQSLALAASATSVRPLLDLLLQALSSRKDGQETLPLRFRGRGTTPTVEVEVVPHKSNSHPS